MRLTTIIPAVLAATSALASPRYVARRGNNPLSNIIQARQAKVHRDLVDVCASIDVMLSVPLVDDIIAVGKLDVCLCLSVIPDFCHEHPVAKNAVSLVGEARVIAILEDLVNQQPDKCSCTFPDHAHSICVHDNPCGFGCGDGYEPYTPSGSIHPSKCYCAPPHTECNGKCGSFPQGCGSAVPAPPHRRQLSGQKCPVGQAVCGVDKPDGWECVNTTTNKESCGGCMIPPPSQGEKFVKGNDCTAIPHVVSSGVDCRSGSCFVRECESGYVPSAVHDACVPITQ